MTKMELEHQLALQLIAVFDEFFPHKKVLGPSSEIYNELGIGGDDADEYLLEIGAKFNVDLSKLETHKYFPDEGAMIENWPFKILNFKSKFYQKDYESFNFLKLAQYILNNKKAE